MKISRFIPTGVHAYFDYIGGIGLLAAPFVFGFYSVGGAAVIIPMILGIGLILYSLLTNYELGIPGLKFIPMPLHLAFDLVASVFLAISPFLFGFINQAPNVWLLDIIAGVAVGNSGWMERVRQMIIYLGGSMDPGAAYLLIRGIKTLGVRVQRQCENAIAVAKFLERHPRVGRVHYPGLKSHADHKLAAKQMRGFGSMLAFDMKGGLPAARRFCDRVRLFLLAASLGGVESLVILPIYSSHYNMSNEELRRAGVSPGTVRVSIGLEDEEDLIEDLKQALG